MEGRRLVVAISQGKLRRFGVEIQVRPVKPGQYLRLQGLLTVAQRGDLGWLDQRVKRSLVHVLRSHLLLLLRNRHRAAPVLVADDKPAVDQLAELVVRGLIVPVQGLQSVDLLLHLGELRHLGLLVGFLVSLPRLVGVDLRFRAPAL